MRMATVDEAFAKELARKLRTCHSDRQAVADVMDALHSGEIDEALWDIVAQGPAVPTSAQAWVYAWLMTQMEEGNLSIVGIEVGSEPWPNADVDRNRAGLAKMPSPFSADVHCVTGAPSDGTVEWNEDIVVCGFDGERKLAPAHLAPLEIGATKPHTTWFHLAREGSLARWPYGSSKIWLITATKPVKDWGPFHLAATRA